MPNHVHALFTQGEGRRLGDIVGGWKSWSAKAINREIGGFGLLWQRDYFDRFMRDEDHFDRALAYVEENPVRAGLASSAAAWPFGSAADAARLAPPR